MSLQERLDAFGRSHPRCVLAALVLLTILVTLVFLYQDVAPAVLYEDF